MRSGQLRERIIIERQSEAPDEYGNVTGEWADQMTVWADIRETTGKEKVEAGRVEASRMATIRVRRSSQTAAITEADRVQARGVAWNIRSIAQITAKGAMLEMLCEAGAAT